MSLGYTDVNSVWAEDELWGLAVQIVALQKLQQSHLDRSHEHDANNNSFLVGAALGDVHETMGQIERLQRRCRDLIVIVGEATAKEICVEVTRRFR
jgi:hypothetical protein